MSKNEKWVKAGLKTNIFFMTLIVLIIFLLINYINYRHYERFDLTQSSIYSLSDKTKNILESLQEPLNISVFFQPDNNLFSSIENLLQEYSYINDKVKIEYIDPDKDVARVEMLVKKFNVNTINAVVFSYKNRHKIVFDNEIVEYDYTNTQFGEIPAIKGFRGEEVFTSAILNILQEKQRKVYFITGHGEIESSYSGNTGAEAFNRLRRDNLLVEKLVLVDKEFIPDDADLLIIAGPNQNFTEAEITILDKYLQFGGRLLVAQNPMQNTGLEAFLKKWGVILNNDIVVDPQKKLSFSSPANLYLDSYSTHPIVNNMRSTASLFNLARSITLDLEGKDMEGMPLILTSEAGWGEVDLNDPSFVFTPDKDKKGPVAIAGVVKSKFKKGMRLAVFGDSDFFNDKEITNMGNGDIFINTVNWLMDRENLIYIGPKTPQKIYLTLNSNQLDTIFWFSVIGLPFLSIAIGILVLWKRRQ
ncbi:GldG family protein [Candidatus Desantisbacteria bacterium]|nr:GldG family protein [Candidatus Desantisbacteria bacterium]